MADNVSFTETIEPDNLVKAEVTLDFATREQLQRIENKLDRLLILVQAAALDEP